MQNSLILTSMQPHFWFAQLAVVLSSFSCTHAQTRELDDSEILPAAIEAIIDNYEKLNTIQARLYSIDLDPKIDKKRTRTLALKGGGRMTLTESPRTTTRVYFASKGKNYRHERQGGFICNLIDGRLTQYNPKTKRVQTRRLRDSGSLVALDPRMLGGRDHRVGLVDQLKDSQLISVNFHDGGIVEISARTNAAAEHGQTDASHRYTLDSGRNWLPIRVIAFRRDGLVATVTDFEYDEALPKTWFMKQVTTNYAGNYQIPEVTPDVKWSQTNILFTFGKPSFNIPVSKQDLMSLTPTAN